MGVVTLILLHAAIAAVSVTPVSGPLNLLLLLSRQQGQGDGVLSELKLGHQLLLLALKLSQLTTGFGLLSSLEQVRLLDDVQL